ncbi:MAG TPA: exodeoxyribonuclease I, partial [Gammaproteobacteria bacterium]
TTVVVPLALHPTNRNGVIVYDLRYPPDALLTLEPAELRARIFTKTEELPAGVERVHLKTIHVNKSPALAPLNTLTDAMAVRIGIDRVKIESHLAQLKTANLEQKIHAVMEQGLFSDSLDPELDLYGGFFSDGDRARLLSIRNATPERLAQEHFAFEDARLPELLFRYRARNFPQTLNIGDQQRWQHYRRERLTNPAAGGSITLQQFEARLQELGQQELDAKQMQILEDLAEYASMLDSFD